MLFSSLTFLGFFLPISIFGYYITPQKYRNGLLLLFSLLFYAWGEPLHIGLMLGLILMNYIGGLAIDFSKNKQERTIALSVAVFINLSALFLYKYADFTIETLNGLMNLDIPFWRTLLPLGISFYTFQGISYLVDVYHKEVPSEHRLTHLALYISFFPQLVAGPILKYHDVWQQLRHRRETLNDFTEGFCRFTFGLAKKILIADTLGNVVDHIFALSPIEQSPLILWGAIAFYGMQLYIDFSGYSDMALGLARLFGFHFPENFNYPYTAASITDLWRRWHISLSTWFKEYVYIPLGGNRKGLPKTCRNLLFVFFLTGLWHGAEWTFVAWGLWQGLFIILEKLFKASEYKIYPLFKPLGHFYTLAVFFIGMVFFRADSLAQSRSILQIMFGIKKTENLIGASYYFTSFSLLIFGVSCLSITGLFKNIWHPTTKWGQVFVFGYSILLLAACFIFLVAASYHPFIYFRF